MGSTHNVYIPDELWQRIREAAATEGARQGRTVSMSEWLRDAAERKLNSNEGEG